MNGLLKSTKATRAINATVAGTTTINGSVIDMQGFENAEAILQLGTLTATNVTTLKFQQGSASDGSDMADITGVLIAGDDTMSNKCLALEVIKPMKRYVRPVVTRATANAVLDSCVVIQSGAHKKPTTQDTTIGASAQFVGP
jgi:hypothetical protein